MQSALLRVDSTLPADAIVRDASLVYDLGLDSLRLEAVVALIKRELSDTDLTPWYVRAAHEGQDTVGGLVDFLAERGVADN
jgi:hypothetical protein